MKNNILKIKSEKGSATVFVLISVLFFTIVLLGIYSRNINKLQQQEKEIEGIKQSYEKNADEEYEKALEETMNTALNKLPEFSTDYGLVDVIWLEDKTNNYTTEPNAPILNANGADDANKMTPVTWTKSGDVWSEDATANKSYYSYNSGNGTEDNLTSEWANAKNKDGSYFVWIPRFAYRITYYSDAEYTNVTGYWDGKGLYGTDGTLYYKNDIGIETTYGPNGKYIVHPAFGTYLDLGGWDNGGLKGFWVAKYEMSQETYSSSTNTWSHTDTNSASDGNIETSSTIRAVSVPNQTSWRYICIGNMYLNGYNYDREKESHLMKNSEWGAVALLTHSQYGRNGHEIDINNYDGYVTGVGSGSTDDSSSSTIAYRYYTETGAKASTTGNIYGIYDMSGGAWEYVAAFNSKDDNEYESKYASSFAATKDEEGTQTINNSDKYATKYFNTTTSSSDNSRIYTYRKIGDATKEVYKGGTYSLNDTSYNTNWFSDYPYVCRSSYPFMGRGGSYSYGANAGVFCLSNSTGDVQIYSSFRAVLCP